MKQKMVLGLLSGQFLLGQALPTEKAASSSGDLRLREYLERAVDFVPQGSESFRLRRAGKPISEMDLASSSDDLELMDDLRKLQAGTHAFQMVAGILGLPLGLLIGSDNFFGRRTKPTKLGVSDITLPPSVFAPFPSGDLLSFALSVGGACLALYGAWQIGSLLGEAAGTYYPTYLAPEVAKRTVESFNFKLADELGLSASQVATVTLPASPSVPPLAIPDTFPLGQAGSAAWAVREAMKVASERIGPDYRAFLVWTSDLLDFQTGIVDSGSWHVLLAGPRPQDDIDMTVARFGAAPTWRASEPAFTRYRAAKEFLSQIQIDSPRALAMLQEPLVARQVGWLTPGSTVTLFPYFERLKRPVWTIQLGSRQIMQPVGLDAQFGTIVDLPRYR